MGESRREFVRRKQESVGRNILTDDERAKAEKQGTIFYKHSQLDEIESFDVSDRVKLTTQQRQENPPKIAISEKELRELGYYDIQFLRTPQGIIYGAKFPDGSIYLNPQQINANTPIHEFAHVCEKLFAKGIELLMSSEL